MGEKSPTAYVEPFKIRIMRIGAIINERDLCSDAIISALSSDGQFVTKDDFKTAIINVCGYYCYVEILQNRVALSPYHDTPNIDDVWHYLKGVCSMFEEQNKDDDKRLVVDLIREEKSCFGYSLYPFKIDFYWEY